MKHAIRPLRKPTKRERERGKNEFALKRGKAGSELDVMHRNKPAQMAINTHETINTTATEVFASS